jgi:hypothetical protein
MIRAAASSFETHRFAMLLRMRSSSQDEVLTLMVRSVAKPRVSNHEAPSMRGHDSTRPEKASVGGRGKVLHHV